MNRPFYAIGVLLAALAGAMLLVSATNRPRGPQPATAAPAGKGEWQPSRSRGTNFIIVLAAEDGADDVQALAWEAADSAVARPSFAAGCGLDRTTGEIYPQPAAGWNDEAAEPKLLYDAAYDAAMFGVAWNADSTPELLPAGSIEPELLEELDPALQMMRDLLKERPDALRRPKLRRSRLAGTTQQRPTWDDYEQWANSRQSVAERGNELSNSTQTHSAQALRIRQLAAETLQGMSEWLAAAARHLHEQPQGAVAATPAKASQK
ncbi:MAG: hypothetical protein SFU86_09185 [Pirellulaceae bacterium]|nr:hypothetical protein [Pirellulaceae bacterium]